MIDGNATNLPKYGLCVQIAALDVFISANIYFGNVVLREVCDMEHGTFHDLFCVPYSS